MSNFLGIDTSNYTTSIAVYDDKTNKAISEKMLLPVKKGSIGLRQSDAVFHHTVQLPQLVERLLNRFDGEISAIGVSSSPRSEEGSYMPCFLAGVSVAKSLSSAMRIPLYTFSHQQGHIAAVAFSTNNNSLPDNNFIAFHLSGGTTEAVLVEKDNKNLFSTKIVAKSLDLKAGQAIDRTGVMLGLDFPSGAKLDELSLKSERDYSIKPFFRGTDCSLSGIENKVKQMLINGETAEDIAKFCIQSIIITVDKMLERIFDEQGKMPVLFSGGVSSNTLLREYMTDKYSAIFSTPEYSADNACGIAYLASLKNKENYD